MSRRTVRSSVSGLLGGRRDLAVAVRHDRALRLGHRADRDLIDKQKGPRLFELVEDLEQLGRGSLELDADPHRRRLLVWGRREYLRADEPTARGLDDVLHILLQSRPRQCRGLGREIKGLEVLIVVDRLQLGTQDGQCRHQTLVADELVAGAGDILVAVGHALQPRPTDTETQPHWDKKQQGPGQQTGGAAPAVAGLQADRGRSHGDFGLAYWKVMLKRSAPVWATWVTGEAKVTPWTPADFSRRAIKAVAWVDSPRNWTSPLSRLRFWIQVPSGSRQPAAGRGLCEHQLRDPEGLDAGVGRARRRRCHQADGGPGGRCRLLRPLSQVLHRRPEGRSGPR